MNTKLKYVLGVLVFILCICIGFFIKLPNSKEEPQPRPEGENRTKVEEKDTIAIVGDTISIAPQTEEISNEPTIIDKAKVKQTKDGFYSMTVSVNKPTNEDLIYEIPDLKKTSVNGKFSDVPGSKSGSYEVVVKKRSTGQILSKQVVKGFPVNEEKPKSGLTAAEFQSLLSRQDSRILGGKHPKVAKNIAFSYVGIKEGEKKPNDILALLEKVNFETWQSFKVISVGYDKDGRVNSAVIQPIYHEN